MELKLVKPDSHLLFQRHLCIESQYKDIDYRARAVAQKGFSLVQFYNGGIEAWRCVCTFVKMGEAQISGRRLLPALGSGYVCLQGESKLCQIRFYYCEVDHLLRFYLGPWTPQKP